MCSPNSNAADSTYALLDENPCCALIMPNTPRHFAHTLSSSKKRTIVFFTHPTLAKFVSGTVGYMSIVLLPKSNYPPKQKDVVWQSVGTVDPCCPLREFLHKILCLIDVGHNEIFEISQGTVPKCIETRSDQVRCWALFGRVSPGPQCTCTLPM